MATALSDLARQRSVQSSDKLQPATALDEAQELRRQLSRLSVSTRSNVSNEDLNKIDSDGEKRQCSSTDEGAIDSDDFSEDASFAWETASEGTSFEESESDFAYPVNPLPRHGPVGGEEHGHSRSGFSSSSSAWRSASCSSGSTASLSRSVRAILNKLTLEKFHRLYEQLCTCVRSPESVRILLEEVFDKALVQHPFLPMYADLCARLAADARVKAAWPSSEAEAGFTHLLLDMCQSCFAQLLAAEEEGMSGSDLEEARIRRKHRHLGTAKWIGELLVRGLLRSRLLCSCVQQLLQERRRYPEFVEFAVALLRSTGKTFDVASWELRPQLQKLFDEMQELSTSGCLPLRLRFLLKDLLELRAAAWEPARSAAKPSAKQEVKTPAPCRESVKPLLMSSPSSSSKQSTPTSAAFELAAFRRFLTGTLRDLRADRNAKKAVARLKAAAVPRKLQAVEFSDMITRVAEDASGPARRVSFAVLAALSRGEDSAFHPDECVRGTAIFFREVYEDLCEEVPRLSVVMSSELLPLLRKAWASVDFGSFLPKELQ